MAELIKLSSIKCQCFSWNKESFAHWLLEKPLSCSRVEKKKVKNFQADKQYYSFTEVLFVACKSIAECSLITKSRNPNELVILKNCFKYGSFYESDLMTNR